MNLFLIVLTAVALDALLGEPRRFHPLVGFGRLAQSVERLVHRDSYLRGVIAACLLLMPLVLITIPIYQLSYGAVLDTLLLYLAIGRRSLVEHAERVRDALLAGDLENARLRVGYMVSRDTTELDHEAIAKATVESVLENGNDAIFGAIFWFAIAGAPGVVLFRLSNTLDAMWGYRNERYLRFGWAAARLDDFLNFVPARLTAFSYALAGRFTRAWRCWCEQGVDWKSPNAGPVMAAGAGSIGVLLGGPAVYHGALQDRPLLGEGRRPRADDIDRALRLISRALLFWLLTLLSGGCLIEYF